MLDISLFKESSVKTLFDSVEHNLDLYRSGSFEHLLDDTSLFLASSCKMDEEEALLVDCTADDHNEVNCCLSIVKCLNSVSSYLARDERLWTRLAHIEFLNYSRTRWEIPSDNAKAVDHIKKHFFAKGVRGIERDNAISRLWWMATICSKVNGLPLEKALEAFLHQSDVRANIIERPSTSQNPTVLSAVVNKLSSSLVGNQALYEREKFREVMKRLNLEGGTRLLEALDSEEIQLVVDKIATEVAPAGPPDPASDSNLKNAH